MESADLRLRMLFDYTIFHIGLYTTLITALFGLMTFGHQHQKIKDKLGSLKFTVFCFLVAGAAGGVLASNMPEHKTFEE